MNDNKINTLSIATARHKYRVTTQLQQSVLPQVFPERVCAYTLMKQVQLLAVFQIETNERDSRSTECAEQQEYT